jgi:hypothetical protein
VAGVAALVNTTVADNVAAGIFNVPGSDVSITNTIVARNGKGTAWSSDCFAEVTSVNSIDGDGSCKANAKGDPQLGPLQYNGGPTPTMALGAGSVAIDGGSSSACPSHDQRLAPRTGACDIGAFEFGANAPPAPAPPAAAASGGGSTGADAKQPAAGDKSAAPAKTVAASSFSANGTIARPRGGKATFSLRGTAGKAAGLLSFTDTGSHIRLRATSIAGITVDSAGRTVTIKGKGINLASGKPVTFKASLVKGSPGTFRIVLGSGYAAGGRLLGGSVSIVKGALTA